jgi:hypothetical protein
MNPDWRAETKPCGCCGSAFGPQFEDSPGRWARRRYCSPTCGRAGLRRVPYLTCAQCGGRFWSSDRGQRFCSRVCARQSRLADLARQWVQMRPWLTAGPTVATPRASAPTTGGEL